ncbi:MAG: succinate dehydrogenase cytochrome b subunit [Acidobacteriota bacterium]
MSWIASLFRSTLMIKAVMAVTGLMLFGFVLGHMLGNLKLFAGPDDLNTYAEFLREVGYPALPHEGLLWIARLGLLAAVGLHIWSAWRLTVINRSARPTGYAVTPTWQKSTYASRTMRWSGVIVSFFIVYHLLHFTTGHVHSDFIPGDVYHNVVSGFSQPLIAGVYIVANLLLGMHLYHGLWSLFQSLGASGPRMDRFRHQFAVAFSALIVLGNLSFPISVLAGFVH